MLFEHGGIFRHQGITAIRIKNGQQRGFEDYADKLVRSLSTEAHNAGAATHYATNGVEFAPGNGGKSSVDFAMTAPV